MNVAARISVRLALVVAALTFAACSSRSGSQSVTLLPSATTMTQNLFALDPYGVSEYAPGNSEVIRRFSKGVEDAEGMALDDAGHLFIASQRGSRSGAKGNVKEFDTTTGETVRTIVSGVTYPLSVAVDESGDLAIGNDSSSGSKGSISFYTSYGKKLITTVPTYPAQALAFQDSTLYAVVRGLNAVVAFSTNGEILRTISGEMQGPTAEAFDSSGTLYVTNCDEACKFRGPRKGSITIYNASNGKRVRTIGQGLEYPDSVAVDSSDNVYAANAAPKHPRDTSVSEYAPDGTIPIRVITDGIAGPSAVACDASGNLFVANSQDGTIREYAVGASSPSFTIPNGMAPPIALAVGT